MLTITRNQVLDRWNELPDVIKEAIYSEDLNNQMSKIFDSFHLSEPKKQDMSYLCLLVFTGFLYRQDLYKEIQTNLNIDNKLALEIYSELDKKIFLPYRKEIDTIFISFSIGANKEKVSESLPEEKREQVILKDGVDNDEGVVNLRDKNKAMSLDSIGQPKPSPVPVKEESEENKEKTGKAETIKKSEEKKVPQTPMMLHKKDNIRAVAQEQSYDSSEYKDVSMGGVMGSFSTPFVNKEQKEEDPIAEVEIPNNEDSQDDIKISKKDDGVKNVHYSAMKTDLSEKKSLRDISESVSSNNENAEQLSPENTNKENSNDDEDEVVDLSTMKIIN